MAANNDYNDLSDLEREIELEMDDEVEIDDEEEWGEEREFDADEEADEDLELMDAEGSDEQSDVDAPSADREAVLGPERPFEFGSDSPDQEFVDRFLEIAARDFEVEAEVDQAMNEVLNDVASEHLFGSIWKKAKRLGKNLAKNRVVGSLVKKGLSVASGQLPALKAVLQLSKGNLQGALLNLGKQALGAAVPGGPAALAALNSLGMGGTDEARTERETWQNYMQISREAFEYLGDNITEKADQPLEASRLAAAAFQHAVGKAQSRATTGRQPSRSSAGAGKGRVVRYRLRPGATLIVTGGGKIVIRGA